MINRYRVESGQFVGQVDTDDADVITATPPVWHKFKGQPLHKLTWWLAAKFRSCQCNRMPNLADPEGERRFWEEALKELKERGEP